MNCGRPLVLTIALAFLLVAPALGQQVLLVYLPGAPIESANNLADATAALTGYLAREVPEVTLEPRLYRRLADAETYLQGPEGANVVAILAEASFLREVDTDFAPAFRFLRGGKPTYRRLLVVQADSGAAKLVDVQGRSLGVVETAATSAGAFLAQTVFEGEVDPTSWFSQVTAISDDFTAAANVLYGQIDAAMVADHNPFLASHLGNDLISVYESPPLSLPALAFRKGFLSGNVRQNLDGAVGRLVSDQAGQNVLTQLRLDGMEILSAGTTSAGLAAPAPRAKELAIALPDPALLQLKPLGPPSPDTVTFDLEVELPDIPLPLSQEGGSQ